MRSKTARTCSLKTEVYFPYEKFILNLGKRFPFVASRRGALRLSPRAQAQGVFNIKGDERLSEALGRPVTLGLAK
jgi:hypothetical protein